MNKKLYLLVAIILVIFLSAISYSFPYKKLRSESSTIIKTDSTTVSASIAFKGTGKSVNVIIFGYTSPLALVRITSNNLNDTTISINDGYFAFPTVTIFEDTKELCLTSKDTDGRTSAPTCFPVHFSEKLYGIGPVILAPTFTTAKSEYTPNEKVQFSGQAIPNRTVRIKINSNQSSSFGLLSPSDSSNTSLIRQVEANTDQSGKFSIDTASSQPQTQHVYSSTAYSGKNSPKSNTLKVTILPWWLVILRRFLDFLYKNAIFIAFFVEILIGLLYLYYLNRRHHPIALYKQKLLSRLQRQIVPYKGHPLST